MSERGQPRINSKAIVPVPHNVYTDMPPKYTNSLYLLDHLSEEEEEYDDTWSDRTTPTTPQMPAPSGWSDVTLTESVTGRSSYTSWEEDEGVLDRLAGEQMGRMFDAVNQSLYEGKSTDHVHTDKECLEWRQNFPHFRIKGIHLLDSLEDGTEIVDPVIIDDNDLSAIEPPPPHDQECSELQIIGRAMKTHPLSAILTGEERPGLHYEEVLASHGVVEEYFAYSYNTNNLDDKNSNLRRPTRPHRYSKLPPVTPSACLRDSVLALVFDQIWSEVATSLHPLLIRFSRITSRRDSFSESSSLLHPSQSHVPIHDLYLPTDGDPPTRGGLSALQGMKRRPLAPGPLMAGGSHSMDLPSLQKVMTIKPVSLQQRVPSSTLPPSLSTNNSGLQLHPSIDINDNSLFPEFSSSRFLPSSRQMSLVYTPIPLKASEQKIVSGKLGNKRNHLKPLEVPRTPGLPLMEDDMKEFSGLRGQRLVRHTQLPPIDPAQFEVAKSPQIPQSSGTRGHVTFSNRIVSAVTDTRGQSGRSSRKNIIPEVSSDLRPNTSQTLHRSDTPLARRGSNNSVGLSSSIQATSSPIKVVGYAANLHGDTILWEEQEDEFIQPSYNGSRSGHNRSKVFHGPTR